MKSILGGLKFIHSRRQPLNLRQKLVRSRFTNKTQDTVSQCGGKCCTTCEQIIVENSFKFKATNRPFKVTHDIDCNSKFLLYVLTCMGCSKNHIGKTRKKLRKRMNLQRQHIRDKKYRISLVSAHIAQCAANKTIKFTVLPFYNMSGENNDARRSKEQYFIRKFKPSLN